MGSDGLAARRYVGPLGDRLAVKLRQPEATLLTANPTP